ncbi:MAG: TonB-dependent receptor [Microscillaceae bacterium]|nr:TonB-dependent receptor [Microscillaceae bacterium]
MRKIFTLLFWVITASGGLLAQTGRISGQISDEETGEKLIGVTVQLAKTNLGTVSDVQGNFILEKVPAGPQILLISYVGYTPSEIPVNVSPEKTLSLGAIRLQATSIGLREIEVFANIVDEKRQPPTPVATITAQEIEEKMGAQEFPELLKSTPGVFVNTVGGSFGDAQVRIRGFGSENTAVLINGIPVNDMENGRVFWSNWGGMNDVTRNQQVQRGLGVTKLAVSAVGGSINIITKPTEQRKGVQLSYAYSNRSWQNRVMLSASTGLMKGDWAITMLGSTRQGEGFREGTDTDSWAYFLSAYKGFGEKHQLVFTAFGAPQTTNRGGNATETAFEVVGDKRWNPNWGTLNGQFLNANVNRYHKPKFMLNHYWDIKDHITLSTSAYYSLGRGGGTSINRTASAEIAQPINRFVIPGDTPEEFQVPWDQMVAENQANQVALFTSNGQFITGAQSKYILQESRNDHNWAGMLSTLNVEVNENFDLTAGLDYRWFRGFHYQEVVNLLGGDFWIDRERFNDQPNNNLLEPINTPKREGERIGYDYSGTVSWAGAFLQGEYTLGNVDLFATATAVRTAFQRNGKFWHQEFLDSSLGKSEKFQFTNVTFKAGANYRITGRHNVFVNAGFFTRAPFFQDAFVDNRISNSVRGDLENEEIFSVEGGYGYRSARFAANVNVYRTSWQNRAYTVGFFSDTYDDFVNFRMFNVGAIHQGLELDWNIQLSPTLSLQGMASIGDWRWDGNANAIVLADPGLQVLNENQEVFIDEVKVGGSAQTVGALQLRYRHPKFWFMGIGGNFYDHLYADYNPETYTQLLVDPRTGQESNFLNQVERLPNAFTFDLWGGKSWKLGQGTFLRLNANINNIFDNQFVIDTFQRTRTLDNPEPSPFVQYYFGRTYFISASLSFR